MEKFELAATPRRFITRKSRRVPEKIYISEYGCCMARAERAGLPDREDCWRRIMEITTRCALSNRVCPRE